MSDKYAALSEKCELIISQMKDRHKDVAIYAPVMTWSEFDSLLAERDADKRRIAELGEALEKASRANAAQDDHINQQQDRIDTLEKRNAELGKYAGKLEARTLTVKLPQRASAEKYVDETFRNNDLAAIYNACRLECEVKIKDACDRVGISLKIEGE